jgi:hypothetical protein
MSMLTFKISMIDDVMRVNTRPSGFHYDTSGTHVSKQIRGDSIDLVILVLL